MRIFLWHVHGSWMTAFVQGDHEYFVPTLPGRPPEALGRARTWDWPTSVIEVGPKEARDLDVDVVVLQRPEELEHLCEDWLGRRPGRELPAVYLEHNAPDGPVAEMRHPAADRQDLLVVHVTWFNALFWDLGSTPSVVIEHGIVDPGHRFTGELPHAAVVVNEPLRRGRSVGADLYRQFSAEVPLDLFGMGTERLGGTDLPQADLHAELARRRVYLHPFRWTSLGLSLIEAMQLGLPVVALSTTEVPDAVPPGTGVVSNKPSELVSALRKFINDPQEARSTGEAARTYAIERFGLPRFLEAWDRALKEATS